MAFVRQLPDQLAVFQGGASRTGTSDAAHFDRNESHVISGTGHLVPPAAYLLGSVAPDSFHRTPFHGLFAKTLFLGILRLLEEVRMAAIVIPSEVRRRSLTAEITVYTLIIYVEFPCHILWIFVRNVSHKPNGLSFRLN
jgi:hypothetical protein